MAVLTQLGQWALSLLLKYVQGQITKHEKVVQHDKENQDALDKLKKAQSDEERIKSAGDLLRGL